MKKIIRYIKKLFGIHETDCEYWINLSEIKVNPEWRKTTIGKKKLERKLDYYSITGEFESKIILDREYNLVDGYSSVVIAEIYELGKVPVYFVD